MGCKGESSVHAVLCTTLTVASHTRRLNTDGPCEQSTGLVQKACITALAMEQDSSSIQYCMLVLVAIWLGYCKNREHAPVRHGSLQKFCMPQQLRPRQRYRLEQGSQHRNI